MVPHKLFYPLALRVVIRLCLAILVVSACQWQEATPLPTQAPTLSQTSPTNTVVSTAYATSTSQPAFTLPPAIPTPNSTVKLNSSPKTFSDTKLSNSQGRVHFEDPLARIKLNIQAQPINSRQAVSGIHVQFASNGTQYLIVAVDPNQRYLPLVQSGMLVSLKLTPSPVQSLFNVPVPQADSLYQGWEEVSLVLILIDILGKVQSFQDLLSLLKDMPSLESWTLLYQDYCLTGEQISNVVSVATAVGETILPISGEALTASLGDPELGLAFAAIIAIGIQNLNDGAKRYLRDHPGPFSIRIYSPIVGLNIQSVQVLGKCDIVEATSVSDLTYTSNGRLFEVNVADGSVTRKGSAPPKGIVIGPQNKLYWIERKYNGTTCPKNPQNEFFQVMQSNVDGSNKSVLISCDRFFAQFPKYAVGPSVHTESKDQNSLLFDSDAESIVGYLCSVFKSDFATGLITNTNFDCGLQAYIRGIAPDGIHTLGGSRAEHPKCDIGPYIVPTLLINKNQGTVVLNNAAPLAVQWLNDGRFVYSVEGGRGSCDIPPEVNAGGYKVVFADRNGSTLRVLDSSIVAGQLAVSPDEQQLAYITLDKETQKSKELWIVNLDGSKKKKLANVPEDADDLHWRSIDINFANPPIEKAVIKDNVYVYLGSKLLLDATQKDLGCFGVAKISYSPTGEYFVVILGCIEGDNEAFLFRADGTDKRRITGKWDYINYCFFKWEPDGKSLIYSRINSFGAPPEAIPASAPPPGIVRYDVQTREKTLPYRVVNVASDDVLNVRSQPDLEASIVGTIPPDGTDVQLTGKGVQVGNNFWVPIKYKEITGWVNTNYLTALLSPEVNLC
jgi:hypothetical protein